MKKSTKRKLGQLGLALGIGVGVLGSPLVSHATDNFDNDYLFHILSYQLNTREYEESAYRQTTSIDNPWKVQMTWSEESDSSNTITRFWLEKENETNVSAPVDKLEGDPASYVKPYSTANQTTVYLTAENNNYNLDQYLVEGIWDEETW
ncbi:DUF2712 domain-containing protein [Niallia sp. 01092]|uniref:DUF2712 domain-containing protein n=1 Tax=unclassified Niallia TaxID=2837522 RepID=UPI003FCF9EDB